MGEIDTVDERVDGTRRSFLRIAGLAGCTGGDGSDGTPTETDTETTDEETDTEAETETETETETTETDDETETETETETEAETSEPPEPTSPHDDIVFGYFPGWGREEEPTYAPGDIPFEKVTDVLYAFLDVDPDGTVKLREENEGAHETNLSEFAALADDTDTRFHPSVGGWTLTQDFPEAAATEENRQRFADTAIELLREYNFDGIDIDWEHPGQCGNDGQSDPADHVALLETVRERLDEASVADDQYYYLSIAGSASLWSGSDLEHEAISELCDHVFVMAYDMTGTWHGQSGLDAPLYEADYDVHEDGGPQQSVQEGVEMWLEGGADPETLALGLPFYGRSVANVPADNNGLFQPFEGVPEASQNGVFTFTELEEQYLPNDAYERYWHEDGMVPWLYSESEEVFVSYDDEESIQAKVEYATERGFSGVVMWELSQDRNETLLDTVNDTI